MPSPAAVHPLQPRFSQAITGMLCLEALVFDTWPVVVVALGLVVLNLIDPRISPVAWLFRLVARPPDSLEPVAPVRFAQIMAVVFLGASVVLFALGADVAGWILAGVVAAMALGSAITGICFGCEIYRFLLMRHRGEGDMRGPLGLQGSGPWVVVLTAPGCARCGPVVREFERVSDGREVVQVDIARRPEAAALPVRSVPAAIAVGKDGAVRLARAGRLAEEDLRAVLAAV
jgi:Domain of unknown function (DUF4395)